MKKLLISAWAIAFIGYSLQENMLTQAANAQTGTLVLVDNGEDFIRQGFVSKDGWQIDFDHAYVTLNQEAIGFEPLASLAQNGQLKVNQTDLEQKLDSENYEKLQQALFGLGHVGEGHCRS